MNTKLNALSPHQNTFLTAYVCLLGKWH